MLFNAGIKINAANSAAIFDKAMKLSNNSRQKKTAGEVINLMSSDLQIMFQFLPVVHNLWIAPIQLVAALILLHNYIGDSMFAGLAMMIVLAPFNGVLMSRWNQYAKEKQKYGDKRLKLITDVIKGIRMIKLYAWENSFISRIMDIRSNEVGVLYKIYKNSAMFMLSIGLLPILISVVTFSVYALSGNELTAERVFVSLSLLELVRGPLFMFPMIVGFSFMANVSAGRVRKFLLMEEQDQDAITQLFEDAEEPIGSVSIVDGEFKWSPDFSEEEIAELEAEAEKEAKKKARENRGAPQPTDDADENTAKTPAEGSGQDDSAPKETKEDIKMDEIKVDMSKEKGKATVASSDEKGSTIRSAAELLELAKQPQVSCLTDLNVSIQPGQLVMIVGSVGSGKSSFLQSLMGASTKVKGEVRIAGSISFVGQQPWIHNETLKNNILMDTPYDAEKYLNAIRSSAMVPDLRVLPAGDLTEIGEQGINLSGGQKARVAMARCIYNEADIYLLDDPLSAVDTHVAQHLFDHMIDGALKNKTRLLVTNQLQFLQQADLVIMLDKGRIAEIGTYEECLANEGAFKKLVEEHGSAEEEEEENTIEGIRSGDDQGETDGLKLEDLENLGKLTEKEQRDTGKVKGGIFKPYITRAGGMQWFIGFLIVACFATVVRASTSYWLAIWTADQLSLALGIYIAVYAIWTILGAVLTYGKEMYLVHGFVRASDAVHEDVLRAVLSAPMRWFDSTPVGRILNRFSKDLYVVDSELPSQMSQIFNAAMLIFTLLVIISSVAVFLPPVLIIFAILFYKIQLYYRNSSRELQRLESISKSPVLAHFTEAISGVDTIRAMKLQKTFRHYTNLLVDFNHKAFYTLKMSSRWFDLRIAVLGAIVNLCTGIFLTVSPLAGIPVDPAFAGLALGMISAFVGLLNYWVFLIAELEVRMTNLDRLLAYSELPKEEAVDKQYDEVPQSWPDKGEIVFDHYSMRYREGLDLVLKDINVTVSPGQTVGVVGRTGAGKSSLILALTRMVEGAEGCIRIDGIDVAKVALSDLRSRIAIIPQSPTLFDGSLRFNLDPFNEKDDVDIWDVLESIQLKDSVSELKDKLEYHVAEGGVNFSVGERQLICIGRALLRDCSVVLLDEATASVDIDTDALIQKTVRTMFKGKTVVTIAHRLNTIMDNDRILVMDDGNAAEFASPTELLEDEESLFYALVNQTGSQNFAHLKGLAASADKARAAEEEEKKDV
eukprot:TRINITY_DN1477_c0_g1_i3.p1 TRINITY_DN1477_c0_g1~~TRINITY_DN1477_c0_g1_i3.p1  ORF type:complete len:1396 (-),score=534.50 TRINITY_DN1477_c0_g1_i3:135-3824(-)